MKVHTNKDLPLFIIIIIIAILIFGIILRFEYKSEGLRNLFEDIKAEELFMQVMKSENRTFFSTQQNDYFTFRNISEVLLKLTINIKPTDFNSFMINEIPGLASYDTKIIVAGEGTDLTTLPYESPPPINFKEKEVSDHFNKDTNEKKTEQEHEKENGPKSVFIYHTHSRESFLPLLKDASKPNEAISSNNNANVIAIGARLSNNLSKMGIGTGHDKTNVNNELLERQWSYSDSYKVSNEIVNAAISSNKKYKYFIDLHRDSARKEVTTKNIEGKSYARLYFIIGKENKNYERNLEFSKEINTELEKRYPGISRGIFLKTKNDGDGVYNQDVSDRAILIELGGVDNTIEEINRTIDAFAEVFADYYWKENEAQKQ
ncbi:stage II sporulation protein P [Lederbergia sp. NSJ-179]|uniref:stage II sporulation protein P n=1 Tax=Lederbergia sp. NSJ-179 TaxID=2931402 RepID=UPI001FD3BB6D|nr:stage II sporulation protein P [Lederbergia sp. NSJ-179]MCJ7840891.1 stage II sporulation protein P [Lederbergia sp. NSJ-179]